MFDVSESENMIFISFNKENYVNLYDRVSLKALESLISKTISEKRRYSAIVFLFDNSNFFNLKDIYPFYKEKNLVEIQKMATRFSEILNLIHTSSIPTVGICSKKLNDCEFELFMSMQIKIQENNFDNTYKSNFLQNNLIPIGGTIQRVIRTLGFEKAISMFFDEENMMDEIIHYKIASKKELYDLVLKHNVKDWNDKQFKIPGQAIHSPKGYMIFPIRCALLVKENKHQLKSYTRCLDAIYQGSQLPFEVALKKETELFTSLFIS